MRNHQNFSDPARNLASHRNGTAEGMFVETEVRARGGSAGIEMTRPLTGLRDGRSEAFRVVYEAELEYVMTMLSQGFVIRNERGGRSRIQISTAFDVEELTQEAFAQFFKQCIAGRFDEARPVRPYLRRIVINLTLKHLGKRYREDLTDTFDTVEAAPDRDHLEDAECQRLYREFQEELSEEERAILAVYYEEGRPSQSEVGQRVGLSRDQVYRYLQRIRRQARSFFAERGWFDER